MQQKDDFDTIVLSAPSHLFVLVTVFIAQVTAAGGMIGNVIMTVLLVSLGFALYGFYSTRLGDVPCDVEHDTDKIFP